MRCPSAGFNLEIEGNNNYFAEDILVHNCHHVPALEDGGQYHNLINSHQERNPNLRVLGVTATPFRLGHGYIYGSRCKPGKTNLFPALDFKITLNQLIDNDYLVPWRAKQPIRIDKELDGVKMTGGDYNLEALSKMMSGDLHVRTAVETYIDYGEERESVLAFAVTIDHAERLAEAFRSAGFAAAAVHSEMPMDERKSVLESFERGELRVLVNVGILTEGWDSPKVDCVIMCRPTKSPSLFVQMMGRGTRLCEGKRDVLVLDLAENFMTHGDPSEPHVSVGYESGAAGRFEGPYTLCPRCAAMLPARMSFCPECGLKFEPKERGEAKTAPVMELVSTGLRQYPERGHALEMYTSQRGADLCRLTIYLEGTDMEPRYYMGFNDEDNEFFRRKSGATWRQLAGFDSRIPGSRDEAFQRRDELILMPRLVTPYKDDKGFVKVKELA